MFGAVNSEENIFNYRSLKQKNQNLFFKKSLKFLVFSRNSSIDMSHRHSEGQQALWLKAGHVQKLVSRFVDILICKTGNAYKLGFFV